MHHETIRRRDLGLTITGPFSSNRRRSAATPRRFRAFRTIARARTAWHHLRRYAWGNLIPYALSAAVVFGIVAFFVFGLTDR